MSHTSTEEEVIRLLNRETKLKYMEEFKNGTLKIFKCKRCGKKYVSAFMLKDGECIRCKADDLLYTECKVYKSKW